MGTEEGTGKEIGGCQNVNATTNVQSYKDKECKRIRGQRNWTMGMEVQGRGKERKA